MAIVRVNKTSDYTIMSNTHFRERAMSLKAKGLLSLMLSLPDNWDYSIAGLVSICAEKESAIVSTLKELKKFGYLQIDKILPNKTESGRIEYVYNVFEKPQYIEKQEVEKQGLENLGLEIQGLENQGQYNTNNKYTKELNTKEEKESKTCAKRAKSASFEAMIEAYTKDDKTRELLIEWLKVRKMKRAANTDYAIQLNLKKLDSMATKSNMTVNKYLEEVISRGWQAFYEIKSYGKASHVQNNGDDGISYSEAVRQLKRDDKDYTDEELQNLNF